MKENKKGPIYKQYIVPLSALLTSKCIKMFTFCRIPEDGKEIQICCGSNRRNLGKHATKVQQLKSR